MHCHAACLDDWGSTAVWLRDHTSTHTTSDLSHLMKSQVTLCCAVTEARCCLRPHNAHVTTPCWALS